MLGNGNSERIWHAKAILRFNGEKCWFQDPKKRPVISDIVQELEDIWNAEFNEAVQEELSGSSSA